MLYRWYHAALLVPPTGVIGGSAAITVGAVGFGGVVLQASAI
jgi:hypothetical protein